MSEHKAESDDIDRDCTAVGFTGEGRCIEPAVSDGLCATHGRLGDDR